MTAAVLVEGIVKRFKGVRAVNELDLVVPRGTVSALLGSNGAGKTTTVRILATLVQPDAGRALICGYDVVRQPRQVRAMIGLTGQYAAVDDSISGWDNLYLIGRLLDLPPARARARADELLERFELTGAARRIARTYSGGMRRRLDLAASLVGSPQVLFLDEPTTGLDPRSRNQLWEMVRQLVAEGATILLTTQYMHEAEALADSVVVMDRGRVVAAGTPAELKAKVGGTVLRIRATCQPDLATLAQALRSAGLGPGPADDQDLLLSLPIADDVELTAALRAISGSEVVLHEIETRTPGLDEVFLALTGAPDGPHTDDPPGAEPAGGPARGVDALDGPA